MSKQQGPIGYCVICGGLCRTFRNDKYLTVKEREAVRQKVIARDGSACTKCGITRDEHRQEYGQDLHVHRKTPQSKYTVRGCITLCRMCHANTPHSTWRGPTIPRKKRNELAANGKQFVPVNGKNGHRKRAS